MPNGGMDCCGNCSHNRAVQEMVHPHPDRHERFWELSHCVLRDANITHPFWTYCRNFRHTQQPEEWTCSEAPSGWIYASGLFEGYVRIPWDGNNEPYAPVPVECSVCGRHTQEGIMVEHESMEIGFCSNYHYVQWWKTIHEDDAIDAAQFQ